MSLLCTSSRDNVFSRIQQLRTRLQIWFIYAAVLGPSSKFATAHALSKTTDALSWTLNLS